MIHERSLELCKDDKEFITKYEYNLWVLKEELKKIPYFFKNFSSHDETHSKVLIQQLEKNVIVTKKIIKVPGTIDYKRV